MKKLSLISLALLLAFLPISQCLAEENIINEEMQPQKEEVVHIDETKLEVAKELATWLKETLSKDKTLVAIVARKGGNDVKKHDRTGMAHSGLAVYNPQAQTWLIYNLLNTEKGRYPKAELFRTAPLDFFYGQTGYESEALLLIPDIPTQERIYEAILTGKNKQLFFTDDYNLLSRYDSSNSLNCNKWLLMNIVAARIDNYNPEAVLDTINNGFEPGYIRLNAIEKHFARKKNNVIGSEVPSSGPVQTVTIESLYKSDLFGQRLFYSGKEI